MALTSADTTRGAATLPGATQVDQRVHRVDERLLVVDQVDVGQLAVAQRAPDHLVDRRVAIERQAVRRRPQRQGAGEA